MEEIKIKKEGFISNFTAVGAVFLNSIEHLEEPSESEQ